MDEGYDVDVGAALAIVTGLGKALKHAAEAAKAANDASLLGELLEAHLQAIALAEKIDELARSNRDLRDELDELRRQRETGASLEVLHGAYWLPRDDRLDGPFSLRAWDAEDRLVRLRPLGIDRDYRADLYCFADTDGTVFVPVAFLEERSSRYQDPTAGD